MFTGIVTDIGRICEVEGGGDPRFMIETAYDTSGIPLGASIAHAGICLTVIDRGPGWYRVQASAETLGLTTAGHWRKGVRLNLERALCLGDELGGHLVTGHVDGIGHVASREPDGDSVRFAIEAPADLAAFIARKGSVTVDGVSLTVNAVAGARFELNIIPHTLTHTTLGELSVGDPVNLEIDLIARYVARLVAKDRE